MNKAFYCIESILVFTIIVCLNGMFIATVIECGGLFAYFNTNMFAGHAVLLLGMLDFIILFPALFCFVMMTAGKSLDYCMDVILYPFSLIEKITNK